jgi:hypothetical protein
VLIIVVIEIKELNLKALGRGRVVVPLACFGIPVVITILGPQS